MRYLFLIPITAGILLLFKVIFLPLKSLAGIDW